MKMNIYFKGLVVSLLLIAGMFTSCEDQPDKFELTGGLPQVSYIRMPYLARLLTLSVPCRKHANTAFLQAASPATPTLRWRLKQMFPSK